MAILEWIKVGAATVLTLLGFLWLLFVAAIPTIIALVLLYLGMSLLEMAEWFLGNEEESS